MDAIATDVKVQRLLKINETAGGGENHVANLTGAEPSPTDSKPRDITSTDGVDTLLMLPEVRSARWLPPSGTTCTKRRPLLYTWRRAPQNANWDPLLYSDLMFFANYGSTNIYKLRYAHGVWHFGFMDAWSPGYLAIAAQNHNGMLRMYEIFNQQGANTRRRVSVAHQPARSGIDPIPVKPGDVDWSIRNSINYSETAVLTALELTSHVPSMVVENLQAVGKRRQQR